MNIYRIAFKEYQQQGCLSADTFMALNNNGYDAAQCIIHFQNRMESR